MTKPICFCATKSFAFSIGSFNSLYRTHWAARSSIVRPTSSAGKMLLKNKFKCAICFLRHSHSIAWMIMGSNRFSMKMNEIMVKMYTIRSDQWVTVKCRTEIAKYAILFQIFYVTRAQHIATANRRAHICIFVSIRFRLPGAYAGFWTLEFNISKHSMFVICQTQSSVIQLMGNFPTQFASWGQLFSQLKNRRVIHCSWSQRFTPPLLIEIVHKFSGSLFTKRGKINTLHGDKTGWDK